MPALPELIIVPEGNLIRILSTVLQPMNTSPSIVTSLLPELQEAVKHIWPALLAWKLVNSVIP